MITKFKIFENEFIDHYIEHIKDSEPEINDYVIINTQSEEDKYLEDYIGQVIQRDKYSGFIMFQIEFEVNLAKFVTNKISKWFTKNQIFAFSKDINFLRNIKNFNL